MLRETHIYTHGTQDGYIKGCRCKDCKAAHNRINLANMNKHRVTMIEKGFTPCNYWQLNGDVLTIVEGRSRTRRFLIGKELMYE